MFRKPHQNFFYLGRFSLVIHRSKQKPYFLFCLCLPESFAFLKRDSSTRQLNFASVEVPLGLSPRILEDFAYPLKFFVIIKVWITLRTQIGECVQFYSPLSPYTNSFSTPAFSTKANRATESTVNVYCSKGPVCSNRTEPSGADTSSL